VIGVLNLVQDLVPDLRVVESVPVGQGVWEVAQDYGSTNS